MKQYGDGPLWFVFIISQGFDRMTVLAVTALVILAEILRHNSSAALHVDHVTLPSTRHGQRHDGNQVNNEDAGVSHVVASAGDASSPCHPVPYEVLWRRLNLEDNPAYGRRMSIVDPTTKTGENQWLLHRHQQQQYQGQRHRRRRRSSSTEPRTDASRSLTEWSTDNGNWTGDEDVASSSNVTEPRNHRGQRRSLLQKSSPWQCRLETRWMRMPADIFPPYIETGRCGSGRSRNGRKGNRASTCMGGLFECVPRRYTIKVLQRIPGSRAASCYPVPTIGVNATYEDVWMTVDRQVTVGCECSRRREFGHYTAGAAAAEALLPARGAHQKRRPRDEQTANGEGVISMVAR